ncbi:Rhs element Vgr protein [Pseudomonas sp. StFLB209]|uniref:type VI secretion system Vgr family protein n=1 Tax=Pseudomonas sp. StFLB209 TaxID=1028989 RepID=UPI0004F8BCBE|nr:type VI secretion system tip protein TssI/VgrG [Pseudomonas sp. StFLB209]BAP40899.1 Rhs element Vgr protein [Pseudomonas sp. StFLB209]
MSAAPQQHVFTLTLPGQHDFQVLAFQGREALNEPFRFDIQLVSERQDLELQAFLHRPAFLQLSAEGGGIHGQVERIAQGDRGQRLSHYQLSLRPRLANLAYRSNQRIFQNKSVQEIIILLLKEHGILADAWRFHVHKPYPPREYCVQYQESDLQFIQRLCEEEGLHYHFEHSRQGHVLVFGDDQTFFPRLAPQRYNPNTSMVATTPVVKRFKLRLETRSNRTARRDWSFTIPRVHLHSEASSDAPLDLEDYVYPARFSHREHGQLLATRALERHRHDHQLAEGHSDQPQLVSGHFLPLTEHPREVWNELWLLTEIQHEGHQPQVLEEAGEPAALSHGEFSQGYRNRFLATPSQALYRPPLRHRKPRVVGSQTAIVTGPAGQEIHCDPHGRVKVRFHWDRERQNDEHSSCWMRVASGWAGSHYGAVSLPRVGTEVLVTFIEGDPDQPLVSGCLYHTDQPHPYPLPEHKTRSVFKSMSSPGGGGFNEVRIDDRQGQEQIFVHAQRDWDQRIGHDQRVHVGNERHERVEATSYSHLLADEHTTIDADRRTQVQANDHLSVGMTQHVRLGVAQLVEAGREIHLKAGSRLVLDGGQQITLKAGGHFISINAAGITMSTLPLPDPLGMAADGSPAQPLLPGPLDAAASSEPPPLRVAAQQLTFKRSARCEPCEQAARKAKP